MKKISRAELNLQICKLIALRGTCQRGQVGCVITQNNRIVSTGYNGSVTKKDCKDLGCDLTVTCINAEHAERNAIYAASKFGILLDGATLYCTTAPCLSCAYAIAQSGIKKVIFEENYKNNQGILLLDEMGIEVLQHNIDEINEPE